MDWFYDPCYKVEEPGKNSADPLYQGLLDKLFI